MCTHHSNSCALCEKPCRKSDKAIEYDNCLKWHHAACIEMPPDHYNTLNSCLSLGVKGLLWLCDTCSKNTNTVQLHGKKRLLSKLVKNSQRPYLG